MAKDNEEAGEYKRPDATKAFDIYDKQIAPKLAVIDTKRGECSQPWSDIKEHANYPRPVMNFLLSLNRIDDEQKQQHYLLALQQGLETLGLRLETDLVDMAGDNKAKPIVASEAPKETTLFGGGDDEQQDQDGEGEEPEQEAFEASPEELARQSGRRSSEASAPITNEGTGDAARKAMSQAAAGATEAPERKRRAARPKPGGHLAAVH